jgi:hypothetical protein
MKLLSEIGVFADLESNKMGFPHYLSIGCPEDLVTLQFET